MTTQNLTVIECDKVLDIAMKKLNMLYERIGNPYLPEVSYEKFGVSYDKISDVVDTLIKIVCEEDGKDYDSSKLKRDMKETHYSRGIENRNKLIKEDEKKKQSKPKKFSKQDTYDTVSFFFSKKGQYFKKSMPLKTLELMIVKYKIDFNKEYDEMIIAREKQNEIDRIEKERIDKEQDERWVQYNLQNQQAKDTYENLPEWKKKICNDKLVVERYTELIKNECNKQKFNKKLLKDSLDSGRNPLLNYIDEEGNVVIGGVTVIQSHMGIDSEIYQESYIKDLIKELD